MKLRNNLKKFCKFCYFKKIKLVTYINCKVNKKHKTKKI